MGHPGVLCSPTIRPREKGRKRVTETCRRPTTTVEPVVTTVAPLLSEVVGETFCLRIRKWVVGDLKVGRLETWNGRLETWRLRD